MGGASSVSSPGGAQHTVHGDRKDDNGTILQTPNQTAVDLAKVNAFVKESFTSTMMKRGREDTVTRFVASPAARQAFKSFLLHEFSDSDGRLQEFLKDIDDYAVSLRLAQSKDHAKDLIASDQQKNQLSSVLAMTAFARFVNSPFFAAWRSQEVALTASRVADVLLHNSLDDTSTTIMSDYSPPSSASDLILENFSVHATTTTTTTTESGADAGKGEEIEVTDDHFNFVEQAIHVMDRAEIERLFVGGSWMAHILNAAECMPIPFSMSNASSKRLGFPLIYVNVGFEQMTGYTRGEIIGKNCRFLQNGGHSEPESIAALSEALRLARPVRVGITNTRKDGSIFFNHLTMKPIFDQYGRYRYVIGLQFCTDKTFVGSNPQTMLNDRLLNMLPDRIFVDDDDEDL